MMLNILPIPAFTDNYIWLLVNPANHCCAIVDPGTAEPVLPVLTQLQLRPIAILLTHHHWDHTGGVADLLKHYQVPVYGSNIENIPTVTNPLQGDDTITLMELNLTLTIIAIPGHTHEHIAYYGDGKLFCGDTLFTAGCGRVFEDTPTQMYESLMKLVALPDNTLVYCGHEYTLANLAFAKQVEPHNQKINLRITAAKELRAKNMPTVPSTMALEKLTNPFLRTDKPTVIAAAQNISGTNCTDPSEVFRIIRQWKNDFKI